VEFSEATRKFLDMVKQERYILLLSKATYAELENAPPAARRVLTALPAESLEEVEIDAAVEELAKAYVAAGVLSPSDAVDALHVAAATVAGADLILSWNFRHIVNYNRIQRFNSVNMANGYRPVDIRSPLEVAYGEEK